MADSSARNLNYQQSQQQTEQPKKAIVLNPKSVPWTAFEKKFSRSRFTYYIRINDFIGFSQHFCY